jgi:hypothetical protein
MSADLDGNGSKEVLLGTEGMIVGIEANGQPKAGFPINLAALLGPQAAILNNKIAIADLNGDQQKEIIAVIYGVCAPTTPPCPKKVHAFTSNGTLYSGWPANGIVPTATEEITDKPVVARMGGQNWVIIPLGDSLSLTRKIKAINGQGQVVVNMNIDQYTLGESPLVFLSVGDVDNDGYDEVTAQTNDGLYLINLLTAQIRPGFPVSGIGTNNSWPWLPPSMADLDGDGHRDIVAIDTTGVWAPVSTSIRVFNRFGNSLPGWPLNLPNVAPHGDASLLTDVTGDGRADVVFVGFDNVSSSRKIWAFEGNGQLIAGWPYTAPQNLLNSFTALDLNNDNASEIFAPVGYSSSLSPSDYFIRLNPNGTLHSQVALSQFAIGIPLIFNISPAVTFEDLLNDGDAEVFFAMKVGGLSLLAPGLPEPLDTLVSLDTYGSAPSSASAQRLKWAFVDADVRNTRALAPAAVTPTPTATPTATATAISTRTPRPTPTKRATPTLSPEHSRPPLSPVRP